MIQNAPGVPHRLEDDFWWRADDVRNKKIKRVFGNPFFEYEGLIQSIYIQCIFNLYIQVGRLCGPFRLDRIF